MGVPVILNRVVQAVYLEIIDPIVEIDSCENSYEFRKLRNAKNAILSLRRKLKLFRTKVKEIIYGHTDILHSYYYVKPVLKGLDRLF